MVRQRTAIEARRVDKPERTAEAPAVTAVQFDLFGTSTIVNLHVD